MMGKDDFKITKEEFNKFKEAMKKDEFKKLFFDYLDEISDPQNRQKYEEEIAMLEKERGNKIRWIKPEGQFVVKTKYDKNQVKKPLIQSPQRQKTIDMAQSNSFSNMDIKAGMKVFINICQSPEIKDASLQKNNVTRNNAKGQSWSIPYSLTYGRNDRDKADNECVVYDCIFSPNTIRMASNYRFKELIIMTAIEGVERQFDVKLEKKYKIPKMKCKGTPQSSVIREKSDEKPKEETSQEFIERIYKENKDKLNSNKKTTTSTSTSTTNTNSNKITLSKSPKKEEESPKKKPLIEEIDGEIEIKPKIETPKYKIVHRGEIQISDYVNDRQRTHNNRPTSLLITIELPNMIRQSEADLEITENTLDLYVKDKYKLNIKLPYEIIEDEGTATFDRKNRNLVLNLPVVPQKEILVETSNDNVPIEVIDEKGNPIETKENNKHDTTENVDEESKEAKDIEEKKKEEEEEKEVNKKITDYAVVLYENAKIPYAKIHQTMEQLELLLYIPEVDLSSINTKFLGNTFYLEAISQKDHQLYQYLIKLAGPIDIEECGFMVVDTPDDRDIKEEEKEEERPGITRTIKSVKCMIRKKKSEWWSDHVYEVRPKIPEKSIKDSKEEEEEKEGEIKKEGKDEKSLPAETKMIDYIYKDGERNEELFEFKEKIFLTELFVNKLDEYLTKQEKEPKNKKEDEMPQWLRDAINPPKKEDQGKVIELTEEELTTEPHTEANTTMATGKGTTVKITEPEITLKANDIIFDLDDIDF